MKKETAPAQTDRFCINGCTYKGSEEGAKMAYENRAEWDYSLSFQQWCDQNIDIILLFPPTAHEPPAQTDNRELFTGGDWEAVINENPENGGWHEIRVKGMTSWIGEAMIWDWMKPGESEANIRLLAEAKNMYDALKNAKDIMTTYNLMNSKTGVEIESIINRINK